MAVPAVADAGTVAVTTRFPDAPGRICKDVGLTVKAVPAFEAETMSVEPPVFMIWSVFVAAAAPHPTALKSMDVAESEAAGGGSTVASAPVSAVEASGALCPASGTKASPWPASPLFASLDASERTGGAPLSSPAPRQPPRERPNPGNAQRASHAMSPREPVFDRTNIWTCLAPRRIGPFTQTLLHCKVQGPPSCASHSPLTRSTRARSDRGRASPPTRSDAQCDESR